MIHLNPSVLFIAFKINTHSSTPYRSTHDLAIAYLSVLSQPLNCPTASLYTTFQAYQGLLISYSAPSWIVSHAVPSAENVTSFIWLISVSFQVLTSFRETFLTLLQPNINFVTPSCLLPQALVVFCDSTFHIGLQTGAHPASLPRLIVI